METLEFLPNHRGFTSSKVELLAFFTFFQNPDRFLPRKTGGCDVGPERGLISYIWSWCPKSIVTEEDFKSAMEEHALKCETTASARALTHVFDQAIKDIFESSVSRYLFNVANHLTLGPKLRRIDPHLFKRLSGRPANAVRLAGELNRLLFRWEPQLRLGPDGRHGVFVTDSRFPPYDDVSSAIRSLQDALLEDVEAILRERGSKLWALLGFPS
jgi:hypothetical protein